MADFPAGFPLDLPTLALLRAVVEDGTVSAAASRFGISQQAASARLHRAEHLLDVRLMVGTARGTSLTDAGELVAEWSAPVLEAAQRLELALVSLRTGAELVVAASQTIAEQLLPLWLESLREGPLLPELPRLVSGNSADVLRLLAAGTAQLGFVETPDVPEYLYRVTLGGDDLVVVTAPSHPWAARGAVDPSELAGTPLVLREAASGTRRTLERWLSAKGLQLGEPAAEFGSTSAILAAVRAGAGAGVLSRRALTQELTRGAIVQIATDEPITRELTAVWSLPHLPGPLQRLVEVARLRS